MVGSVWSFLARLRRRLRNKLGPLEDWDESRKRWVREHAPGRSFADVGGLFQMEGDVAFAAEEAGASPVTCFDAGDPDLCAFAQMQRSGGRVSATCRGTSKIRRPFAR